MSNNFGLTPEAFNRKLRLQLEQEWTELRQLQQAEMGARATRVEDQRDAARYRVLRAQDHTRCPLISTTYGGLTSYTPAGLDAVCDEIIADQAASVPRRVCSCGAPATFRNTDGTWRCEALACTPL